MKTQTFISLADAKERFEACNCADDEQEYEDYLYDNAIKEHVRRGGDESCWHWIDEDGFGFADEDTEGYDAQSSSQVGCAHCSYCDIEVQMIKGKMMDKDDETKEHLHKCGECDKEFFYETDLIKHKNEAHAEAEYVE